MQMIVNNEYIEKDIYNVIGTIQGQEEPDRYVLLGSHRDAWQFGAAYAAGGTSVTSEIARTIGQLRKVRRFNPAVQSRAFHWITFFAWIYVTLAS